MTSMTFLSMSIYRSFGPILRKRLSTWRARTPNRTAIQYMKNGVFRIDMGNYCFWYYDEFRIFNHPSGESDGSAADASSTTSWR